MQARYWKITKRILVIIGSYLIAVGVADLVAVAGIYMTNPTSPSMPIIWGLFAGFLIILLFATIPAVAFIIYSEFYNRPGKFGHVVFGAVCGPLALFTGFVIFLADTSSSDSIWPLYIINSMAGAAGAFVYWQLTGGDRKMADSLPQFVVKPEWF